MSKNDDETSQNTTFNEDSAAELPQNNTEEQNCVVSEIENSNSSQSKKNPVFDFLLDVSGIDNLHKNFKQLKQHRKEAKNKDKEKQPKEKKNIFQKIVQTIKIACQTGMFICKCLTRVVGPGLYVIEKILEKTYIAAKTTYHAMKAKDSKERKEIIINGSLGLLGTNIAGKYLGRIARGTNATQQVIETASGSWHAFQEGEDLQDKVLGAAGVIDKKIISKTKFGKCVQDATNFTQQVDNSLYSKTSQKNNTVSSTNEEQTVNNEQNATSTYSFKENMLSDYKCLQEARAPMNNKTNEETMTSDSETITYADNTSKPQNLSIEQMKAIQNNMAQNN